MTGGGSDGGDGGDGGYGDVGGDGRSNDSGSFKNPLQSTDFCFLSGPHSC